MGCICSKGCSSNEYVTENRGKDKRLKANKSSRQLSGSLKREEASENGDGGGTDATVRLIDNNSGEENAESTLTSEDDEKPEKAQHSNVEVGESGKQVYPTTISRLSSVSNAERGAQVIAGWPAWLTSVAGEAINGWLPRKAESFEKLDKIGQGTYSSVYRARDLETNKMVALKKVRFANMDPESVRFMAREILILRRLDHPNVMKLEGLIASRVSGSLYLIFEYMEHDLAGLAANPGIKFTEAQIKCYMRQLLLGLEHCHNQGVLHRDIKGSNLLIDKNGNLKIGDFGLATFLQPRQNHPHTSRVVTLWYRPPELLLGATDYGVAVDLWSTGCILAELFAGKPIMPGRTEVEQLHKIFKLCGSPSEEYWKKSKLPHTTIFKPQHPYRRCVVETFKDFPSSTLAFLEVLLAIEPEGRGTASSALKNEFFTTKPLPCDPSTLPKYPPSKEFDAKLRDEETRRRRAALGTGHEHKSSRKGCKVSKAVPAPDANAELQASIQKRQGQANPKSISEKFIPEEDGGSGFPIDPPKAAAIYNHAHSGQSMHPSAFGSSRNMSVKGDDSLNGPLRTQRSYLHHGAADQLSRFSNSVAARDGSRYETGGETSLNPHWRGPCFNGKYNHLDGGESLEKHEWSRQLMSRPKSSYRKDGKPSGKESLMVYAPDKNKIHYSGPLIPPGGNIEEMLKEHEKQIQYAVRQARIDKAKNKSSYNDINVQTESLLYHAKNR